MSAQSQALLVGGRRTPVGKYGGALSSVRPDDLAALTIKAVIEDAGIDPSVVDEVILGNANGCLLYTSPSPRDKRQSRMPSSA